MPTSEAFPRNVESSTEMPWFHREKQPLKNVPEKHVRTEGLWTKCEGCRKILWRKELEENDFVCANCNWHFRIGAVPRLKMLLDGGVYTEFDADLASTDPLQFTDLKPYRERLQKAYAQTGMRDGIVVAEGRLSGRPVVVGSMEYGFIGGSMGAVVGEKITRAIERALAARMPLIVVSASGGARMMEGAVSLMQMAKISAALAQLDDSGIPFISVLTDPTTGGVTASFAMLGDLNIAEPGALIGFAGPRVIEQTIRQKLPSGFQRSEFLLEHGMLDSIVPRRELKSYLTRALTFLDSSKPRLAEAG
jgi:acetyl-CoA carboxylase carboxyl transferase subunit beta